MFEVASIVVAIVVVCFDSNSDRMVPVKLMYSSIDQSNQGPDDARSTDCED